MKKLFLMFAVATAMCLVSCNGSAKGSETSTTDSTAVAADSTVNDSTVVKDSVNQTVDVTKNVEVANKK